MPSEESIERKLTQLKNEEAKFLKDKSNYEAKAAKKRSDAARKRASAERSSSVATARNNLDAASKLEKDATALDTKIAATATKLVNNQRSQRDENRKLRRARKHTSDKQRREADRERQREKQHAREIARLSRPTVQYIHEIRHIPSPKPEELRVLYLTANPPADTRIRVDAEVRSVREEVKKAIHRDSIDIDHWPAATPVDLISGLNDKRPHVVHFSGHGGGQALEFDDGQVIDSEGIPVGFDLVARALAATDTPPFVVVLNACDTLDGAEVLLAATPVVIATTTAITDLAANVFAARFYGAIASGQSVQAAIDQARIGIDLLASGEGDVVESLTRDDVDLCQLVLVQAPDGESNG
jgi:hypothetical protein